MCPTVHNPLRATEQIALHKVRLILRHVSSAARLPACQLACVAACVFVWLLAWLCLAWLFH